MRIFFLRPHPYLPESFAGTQITLHWLIRKLISNGHEVALAVQTRIGPPKKPKLDHECGYPVFRAANVIEAAPHQAMPKRWRVPQRNFSPSTSLIY